jgi:hypothetical protein
MIHTNGLPVSLNQNKGWQCGSADDVFLLHEWQYIGYQLIINSVYIKISFIISIHQILVD